MKVGVIMGGISSEKEVSLLTGIEFIQGLNKEKYDVKPIILHGLDRLYEQVSDIDFALIALHGNFGEDGKIQAVLETLNIPYSGSGVLASGLCMDKNISKKLLHLENIKTPKWRMINEQDLKSGLPEVSCPIVIKPNNGGSSIGTSIIYKKDEYEKAVALALDYDKETMMEEYIKGTEITCCIFNGEAFPIIEIKPKAAYFDYHSKYDEGGAEETIIKLPEELESEIYNILDKCWHIFKLQVYARIDMIIKDEQLYVLEINTLPGMTRNSLFPKSAKAIGIDFKELLDQIIEVSLQKK